MVVTFLIIFSIFCLVMSAGWNKSPKKTDYVGGDSNQNALLQLLYKFIGS